MSYLQTMSSGSAVSTACVQALEIKKTVACDQARNASESLCSGSEDMEREYEYEPKILLAMASFQPQGGVAAFGVFFALTTLYDLGRVIQRIGVGGATCWPFFQKV
ncbi:hypothetical protein L218DRAFT_949245 [Marasmius fiardii PR-910]|nr:hypothetical protein L218DRAFT_949245 [Marasmius fiardii PR-910]